MTGFGSGHRAGCSTGTGRQISRPVVPLASQGKGDLSSGQVGTGLTALKGRGRREGPVGRIRASDALVLISALWATAQRSAGLRDSPGRGGCCADVPFEGIRACPRLRGAVPRARPGRAGVFLVCGSGAAGEGAVPSGVAGPAGQGRGGGDGGAGTCDVGQDAVVGLGL